MRLYSVPVIFALFLSARATTYFNRAGSVFPMFDDPNNVPVDTYIDDGAVRTGIDSNDNFDTDGADIDITAFSATIFGDMITNLRCFDIGFCDCAVAALTTVMPTDIPTDTANGLDLAAGKCRIAPFVGVADNANQYHMAYRIVDVTLPRNLHDIDRISAEVNTALDQYKTKFSAKLALIVSWRMTSAAGDLNEFQAILAVGETDTGATETYVIFIYGTMAWAGTGVQGFVTGLGGGAAAGSRQFARVCSQYGSADVKVAAPLAELVANSNYKCGDTGIYVFGVEAADKACVDETTACDTEFKPACNQTSVPMKTCTETYYCTRRSDNTGIVSLKLHLKWYKWGRIQALDYDTLSMNSDEQVFVNFVTGAGADTCGKDLVDPDTENSIDVFELDVPIALSLCGVKVDTTAGSISFAFKIYDGLPNSAMIDKYGDNIISGTCFYDDLALSVTQTVMNNGPSTPTVLPTRNRILKLEVVDRPVADNAEVLTVMPVGRGYYLRVTYDAGTPFNRWTDPYGVYVAACFASNNAAFVDDDATWERSEEFITASCPVDRTTLEAVWLTKSFEADPVHAINPPVEGNVWYQIAGPIIAARWNKINVGVLQQKIFFKCTVEFCTLEDEFANCEDACNTDRRKRRSIANDSTREVLYTSVSIVDSSESPATEISETACTSFNIALSTLVALLALLLISATLCILIFLKLTAANRQIKRRASIKKDRINK